MHTTLAYLMALVAVILSSLSIISLATDNWEVYEEQTNVSSTDPVSIGLWRICRRNDCFDFSEFGITNALKAVRAFIFMGMLIGLVAALFSGRMACGKPDSKHFMNAAFFFIPLFLFIGMIIYSALDIETEFTSAEVQMDDIARTAVRSYGYSFIIGWVTFILSLIAFIACVLLNRSVKSVDN